MKYFLFILAVLLVLAIIFRAVANASPLSLFGNNILSLIIDIF